jgi:hypothetical protein
MNDFNPLAFRVALALLLLYLAIASLLLWWPASLPAAALLTLVALAGIPRSL